MSRVVAGRVAAFLLDRPPLPAAAGGRGGPR
jgi:hypothetical protein